MSIQNGWDLQLHASLLTRVLGVLGIKGAPQENPNTFAANNKASTTNYRLSRLCCMSLPTHGWVASAVKLNGPPRILRDRIEDLCLTVQK
jgi:hypothetical protein